MAEGGESGYDGDLESEYESTSELKESTSELKNESIEESTDIRSHPNIKYTAHGHRMEIEYPIPNLACGYPFWRYIVFETRCPTFPTSWRGNVDLERAENEGPICYTISMKRFGLRDKVMDGAAWVRFRQATSKDFFHEEEFQMDDMRPGHEISGSGAVPAEILKELRDKKLVLRVDLIARLCHGSIKRKRESNSSSDNW